MQIKQVQGVQIDTKLANIQGAITNYIPKSWIAINRLAHFRSTLCP